MNEGWIEISGKEGTLYPIIGARFEMRPGIAASVGQLDIPVLLTDFGYIKIVKDFEASAREEFQERLSGVNYPGAVGAYVDPGLISSPNKDGTGSRKVYDLPEKEFDFSEEQILSANDLFDNEISLTLKSVNTSDKDDKDDKETERFITIKRLRVSEIVPIQPPGLNEVVLCRISVHDRRTDWLKLDNFSDAINVFKGLDTLGGATYYPETCWNPAGFISSTLDERKPWNLRDAICYCLTLMGEADFYIDETASRTRILARGSRHTGYVFDETFDVFFEGKIKSLGNIPENINYEGANPAWVLFTLLGKYNLMLWFTHDSMPLICRKSINPELPSERDSLIDVIPYYSNVHDKRSRNIVIAGSNLRMQELHYLEEDVDFEYVLPLSGEWKNMWEVWERYKPIFSEIFYTSTKSDLAALSALANDGNLDKFFASRLTTLRERQLIKKEAFGWAMFQTMGFRYIRLKRGIRWMFRKPLEKLLTVNSDGDHNTPIILGHIWQPLKIRAGYGEDEVTFENKEDQFKLENYPQGARLIDADQLIFGYDEPFVFPTEERQWVPSPESGYAGLAPRSHNIVQDHTAYVWDYSKELMLLVASEAQGLSTEIVGTVSADKYYYYSTSEKDDKPIDHVQPPLVMTYAHFRPDIILAKGFDGDIGKFKGFNDTGEKSGTNLTDDPRDIYIGFDGAGTNPIDLARKGEYGLEVSKYFNGLDALAGAIVEDFQNSNLAENAVDFQYGRIYTPIGNPGGSEGELDRDSYQYNAYLGSIEWGLDDSGAYTLMRFGNTIAFHPDIGSTEQHIIELLGQKVFNNQLERLTAFREAVLAVSGTNEAGRLSD